MEENSINQVAGQPYKDIKQSYTGSAVDMFIPFNDSGETIYGYDVNSLYPSQMLNKPMPIDNMTFFQGNIRDFNPNAFGFFYCKVETPKILHHPMIQLHVKTNSGIRTISPLGNF